MGRGGGMLPPFVGLGGLGLFSIYNLNFSGISLVSKLSKLLISSSKGDSHSYSSLASVLFSGLALHILQISPIRRTLYSYFACNSFNLPSRASKLKFFCPLQSSVESERVAASRRVSPMEKVSDNSKEEEGSVLV